MAKKDQKSSINDILPLEILLEIFHKLPVKQLHRNKIVYKLWSSLISHPSFHSQYSLRAKKNSRQSTTLTLYLLSFKHRGNDGQLFYNVENITTEAKSMSTWSKDCPRFSLEFLPDIPDKKFYYNNVLASSNGLLLCSRTYYPNREYRYYVCNPVTKQFLILPSPPTPNRIGTTWGIVYYPSGESANGWTQTQFKVIKMFRKFEIINTDDLTIEIFESATNRWRVLNVIDVDHDEVGLPMYNAVEHRGILYGGILGSFIRAFDPNRDLYRKIMLPGEATEHSMFGVSQDNLYYVLIDVNITPNISCTIWRCDDEFELGEYTWSVHRKFDLDWIDLYDTNIYLEDDTVDFQVLAIDPMNCNVLYISANELDDSGMCRTYCYAVDLVRREIWEICNSILKHSDDIIIGTLPFVQPIWPTTVPQCK